MREHRKPPAAVSLPRRVRARWILETLLLAVLLTVPLPTFRLGLTQGEWSGPLILGATIYVCVAVVRVVWREMHAGRRGQRSA